MLRRVQLLRTPFNELTLTGSCWSRFFARSAQKDPAESPSAPVPFITLIPTLHVASVKFYDKLLDYMVQAVKERDNLVILLEGICDTEESEVQQMEEYFAIAHNQNLKTEMLQKADQNTLYDEETIKTICEELAVNYGALVKLQATVRLQECYLKPKMAALVGSHLRNDADLNMNEVAAILAEKGSSGSVSVPFSRLGADPAVRGSRERKVAKAAQMRCVEWLQRGCGGEVLLPWGFYHAEGIRKNILATNSQDETVVFLESDDKVCRLPFGISKELLA
ncbi:putative mitochondrial DNA topoisomerase II [Trypanosoma rangeli]|uniref:Putative mitochondrial DNA topoisomerase II n=1 Tax=Trypanosoma rangeli TaxID=5698 RepID=A0A3R7KS20_TRYRA|nr:putative mitochondrial DNA topoisomerase II [Trypanosoma rangeli]RNF00213.1 putative mitochondrial DNA topoisomerase II [Trypanosoma rangeli]|eukprot:RNF00213.1 putative mitochondrial DNA topoisomerase II [Trypanosoma rangeli]